MKSPNIDEYINNIMPQMHGWCSPAKAAHLHALISEVRPKVCIEIGVYAGRSLFAIALSLPFSGRILGIDPWTSGASIEGFEHDPANRDWWRKLDHDSIRKQFEFYKNQLGVAHCVDTFVGTSRQAYGLLQFASQVFHQGQPFIDFLHIDGNHSTVTARMDVDEYVPLVRQGAPVVMDDLDWSTTKEAQQRLDELCVGADIRRSDQGVYGVYRRR